MRWLRDHERLQMIFALQMPNADPVSRVGAWVEKLTAMLDRPVLQQTSRRGLFLVARPLHTGPAGEGYGTPARAVVQARAASCAEVHSSSVTPVARRAATSSISR